MKVVALFLLFQMALYSAQDFQINIAASKALPASVNAKSIAYDETNRFVYMAGLATNSIDPGQSINAVDSFVAKFFVNGTRIWSRIIGGTGTQSVGKVIVDSGSSDLLLLGGTTSPFDGQQGKGGFTIRYAMNGTKLFTTIFPGFTADCFCDAVFQSDTNRLVATGQYNGDFSMFVIAANNGSLIPPVLTTLTNGFGAAIYSGVTLDDFYAVGNISQSLDGQPFAGGTIDAALTKTNVGNSTRYWSRTWGTGAQDLASGVRYDQTSGLIFVTGVTLATGSFNGQPMQGSAGIDSFVLSVADNGTLLWTTRYCSGANCYAQAINIHAPTNVLFVVGSIDLYGTVWTFARNGTLLQRATQSSLSFYSDFALALSNTTAFVADTYGFFVTFNISLPQPIQLALPPRTTAVVRTTASFVTSAQNPVTTFMTTSVVVSTTSFVTSIPVSTSVLPLSTAPVSSSESSSPQVTSSTTSDTTSGAASSTYDTTTSTTNSTNKTTNVESTSYAEIPAEVSIQAVPTRIIVLSTAPVIIAIIAVFTIWYICSPKRKGTPTKDNNSSNDLLFVKDAIAKDSGTVFSEFGASIIGMSTMGTTIVRSEYELSLPGYLNVDFVQHVRIRREIARGGGGIIYRASSSLPHLSQEFVVKMITMSNSQEVQRLQNMHPEEQQVFRQEVSIIHYFREHRNFVKLLGWSDDPACMLLKHYKLGSLEQWMYSPTRKTKRRKLQFLKDIVDGVSAMHRAGFVHCDLKPANVLIDIDPSAQLFCVLTDFGVSQVVDEKSLQVKTFSISNARGMSFLYAAPETIRYFRSKMTTELSAEVIMATDLYSVGIIVLELLNLRRLWR